MLVAIERDIGIVYGLAKQREEYAIAAGLQAARRRMHPHIELYRDFYASRAECEPQLELLEGGAGRAHDGKPAA
jgi:hypothetical protein